MRIAIVVGTRPEAIKLAPIAELLGEEAFIIHTGQHHTAGMNGNLQPHHVLNIAHGLTRGQQLGAMTAALDHVFRQHRPDAVIVQGDTTSALAGALAANTTNIPFVHVEAGLRSFDRAMPEEHNRVLIDHLADLCCAPTPMARDNLLAERISAERIATTGNTIIEAVNTALPCNDDQAEALNRLGLGDEPFILATFHRPENTDIPDNLRAILYELAELPAPVVLPLHPRTQNQIAISNLSSLATRLRISGPLDYPALLTLIRHAAIVISDSGGIQEEATVLKRPILIIRRSNERPEVENTFGARLQPGPGLNKVATTWLRNLDTINTRLAHQPSPYGDGNASVKIIYWMRTRFPAQTRCHTSYLTPPEIPTGGCPASVDHKPANSFRTAADG